MSLMNAMEILSSGLTATRLRMNVTSSNLANANTTRRAGGAGPYRRLNTVYSSTEVRPHTPFAQVLQDQFAQSLRGVKVDKVVPDTRAPRQVHDPGHPDADANGIVKYPNVNVIEEMVDMIVASRVYEAGVTAMQSVKSMANKALTIGR